MTDWSKSAKYISEAAIWIALFGFGINGCVQCHRIDTERHMKQESKP